MALQAIREAPSELRLFRTGVRGPGGRVDRRRTKNEISTFLEMCDFSSETIRTVARLSPHSRSPLSSEARTALEQAIQDKLGREPTIRLTCG